jgi:hypothetical protein
MEHKTYLEILAENDSEARQDYTINPKDLFVEHNDVPEEQEIEGDDHHEHTELEDKEAFQQFGGSYHEAGLRDIPTTTKAEDHSTTSVFYEKNIRKHVINIDSRFRTNPEEPSTDFSFRLIKPMRNIISLRISSIEFPNTYYTFSKSRGNLSFYLLYYTSKLVSLQTTKQEIITIPEGNYEPQELIDLIQSLLPSQIQISYSINTGKTTFTSQFYFEINIITKNTTKNNLSFLSKRIFDNGLGYNLGFRQADPITPLQSVLIPPKTASANTLNLYTLTSTAMIDTIDNNYIFITLERDWKVTLNQTPDRVLHHSFMKVVVDVPKGSVLYDNGSNTLTKEYWFQQPTDIYMIPVRVSDPYDQTIDLMGMDFSFSLEMKEITNAALHESIRSK